MGLLLMCVAFLAFGLCLSEDKADRRRFLSGALALLSLPVGVILTLSKRNK